MDECGQCLAAVRLSFVSCLDSPLRHLSTCAIAFNGENGKAGQEAPTTALFNKRQMRA